MCIGDVLLDGIIKKCTDTQKKIKIGMSCVVYVLEVSRFVESRLIPLAFPSNS